jgi:hypothetical protein
VKSDSTEVPVGGLLALSVEEQGQDTVYTTQVSAGGSFTISGIGGEGPVSGAVWELQYFGDVGYAPTRYIVH